MRRPKYCPESKCLYWHKDEAGVIRVHPLPCNSWECAYCGKEKHRKLRKALTSAFQDWASRACSSSDAPECYRWPTHVILTIDPSRISRKEAWATIGERFDRFRRGLQRDAGDEKPMYARTIGRHRENEYPHLHLLVVLPRRYSKVSKTQLLKRLHRLWGPHDGGGLVELGNGIDSERAMRRVVGYILADLQEPLPLLPRRGRRVSVSRGIRLLDDEATSKPFGGQSMGGQIRSGNISRATALLRAQGYWVRPSRVGITAEPPRT